MKHQLNWTAIIIALIVLAGVVGIVYYTVPRQSTENIADVTGTAQITVSPDQVVVYAQVLTKAETAEAAKNMNSEISEKVINALKLIGIETKNIETENYNIYQDCEWTQDGQKCKGYAVSNSIKIKSKEFDNAGKIVDAVVDSGALVSYINFELSLEKQNEHKKTVLAEAAKDAKSKAEALASGFGKRVGKLVSVSSSDYNYMPYPLYARAEGVSSDAKQIATNLPSKTLEITATVSARYEIK
ncbi:TPA: SIMPL domain-containing protein [Candidatus Woesearchaeota archaeon]|nr:SIMPL domain-containing protein [Candidatus Woesearchaeota archaeon]